MKIKAEVDEPLCKRITMKLTFFFFFTKKWVKLTFEEYMNSSQVLPGRNFSGCIEL